MIDAAAASARFRTRITDLLGIDHPVILGGLQGLGRAELAAAVSQAGGFGLVTAGCFEDSADLETEIAGVRALTDRPFGVNIAIASRRSLMPHVEVACRAGVGAIFTSGNDPTPFVDTIRSHGITWVHVAPSIRFAEKAVGLGADAVVLVGFEAGGHPGLDDVALSVLVRKAVRTFTVPVIAAGGISDGAGMVAALAWGAEGVQMGTRFVMSRECPLHDDVKAALLAADERSTVVIERSLRKARRVLRTERADEVLRLEASGASFEQLRPIVGGESYLRVIVDGDLDRGVLSTGQNVGLIEDLPAAGRIVADIIREAAATVDRLQHRMQPSGTSAVATVGTGLP